MRVIDIALCIGIALMLLGCTAPVEKLGNTSLNTTSNGNSAVERTTSCWVGNNNLFCKPNINYTTSLNSTVSHQVPTEGISLPECEQLILMDSKNNIYSVEQLAGKLYVTGIIVLSPPIEKIGELSPSNGLMGPCTKRDAFTGDKLNRGYCFYDSNSKIINCWRNVTIMHKGKIENGNAIPIFNFNVSHPASLMAVMYDNKTEFITLCNTNYSQLFQIGTKESVTAIRRVIIGTEFCSDPAGFYSAIMPSQVQ